jgi:hypothetical protein
VGLVRWTTIDRQFWVWSDVPRATREHCTACVRLTVSDNPQQVTIQPQVEKDTLSTTLLNTDESNAYNHIVDSGRGHVRSATPTMNMRETMMTMVSAKSIAIPWKASGLDSAISCARFVVYTRNTWPLMWRYLSGPLCATSVVAKKLGRHYLGVEQDEHYACLAEKRLALAEVDARIQGYTDGVFWERNTLSEQSRNLNV